MSQYDKMDSLIVQRVGDGWTDFTGIFAREVRQEAERLSRAGCGDDFRILDRRLQALRKKGALTFNRKDGWAADSGGANAHNNPVASG